MAGLIQLYGWIEWFTLSVSAREKKEGLLTVSSQNNSHKPKVCEIVLGKHGLTGCKTPTYLLTYFWPPQPGMEAWSCRRWLVNTAQPLSTDWPTCCWSASPTSSLPTNRMWAQPTVKVELLALAMVYCPSLDSFLHNILVAYSEESYNNNCFIIRLN